ncbi:MASE3 domain-containing protein [Cytobacillus sp. FJAT-54145]|uniref:histidine kinase n=1 Tax=Cytobacillus spartinae TaxID=3299023 RepID=A0ABW6KCQ5_9BACI
MANLLKQSKFGFSLLFISFLLIGLGHIYQSSLNELYMVENHIFIHSILELFSVIVCFAASLYGWKAFEETKNRTFLWLPFIFFVVGVFDLLHFMTYPGMPFFLTESSLEKTGWFWIMARSVASIGLLFLTLSEEKKRTINRKWIGLYTFLFLFCVTSFIYYFEKDLPILIVPNHGPTILKNTIEYLLCLLIFITFINTLVKYQKTKLKADLELLFAFSLLLLSEFTITFYTNVSDVFVVIGHIIKAFGYLFILKAFFFSKLQLTFQQKQETEKDLKNTQVLLQSFFDHTPDSITIMDEKGMVLTVNQGFEKVYGWKENEVKGKLFRDIMPELRENIDYVVSEVASGKTMIAYNTTRQRKDGSKILINMTISPIKDEQGKIVQMAAISRDITLQREAENRMLEMERELKEMVRKQQGVIFKFIKVGEDFIHTICDGELLNSLKIKPEQVVGKKICEHPIEGISDALKDYYEQSWLGEDVTFEITISHITCVITLKPVIVNQEVVEVIGSCIDITKLKRTEALLQKSEKLAVVGELAAGLAHEIRNPLTTLKGFTQLIDSQKGETNRSYIELMLSELDRIEMITNEFMAVAKPQAITFQEHDLIKIVKQIVAFSAPQALLNNIEIKEYYLTEYSDIICDINQIKQVFINLVKNAIEAMPNGGSLKIIVENQNDQIVIQIKDSGVGVPKDILPRLGEPFYTLKEKGTGLGLMVSYRIIESHQGTIAFESEEHVGTTVKITLPYKN